MMDGLLIPASAAKQQASSASVLKARLYQIKKASE
jgi:hypothetical protein